MSKGVKWLLIVLAVVVLAIVALILFNTPVKNEMRRSLADSQPRHLAGLVDDPRGFHTPGGPAAAHERPDVRLG